MQKGVIRYKLEKIEIRFTEVMNLSEQIGSISGQISKVAKQSILQLTDSTKAVWQSQSADLLCIKEVKISEQLTKEAENIRKIAVELEEGARAMYLAESANNLLARTRVYL